MLNSFSLLTSFVDRYTSFSPESRNRSCAQWSMLHHKENTKIPCFPCPMVSIVNTEQLTAQLKFWKFKGTCLVRTLLGLFFKYMMYTIRSQCSPCHMTSNWLLRGQVGSVCSSNNLVVYVVLNVSWWVSFKLVPDGDARWQVLFWTNLDQRGKICLELATRLP